jgi:mRNA interferase RelE/StbE
MILYDDSIKKKIKKHEIPKTIIQQFHNAFISLELTEDFSLFDIKKINGNFGRNYYRLRKGNYRSIFYLDDKNIIVIYIGHRKDVYKLWL